MCRLVDPSRALALEGHDVSAPTVHYVVFLGLAGCRRSRFQTLHSQFRVGRALKSAAHFEHPIGPHRHPQLAVDTIVQLHRTRFKRYPKTREPCIRLAAFDSCLQSSSPQCPRFAILEHLSPFPREGAVQKPLLQRSLVSPLACTFTPLHTGDATELAQLKLLSYLEYVLGPHQKPLEGFRVIGVGIVIHSHASPGTTATLPASRGMQDILQIFSITKTSLAPLSSPCLRREDVHEAALRPLVRRAQ
mmetsp:Transcript_4667/g.16724  ORF Transcript_4667/g.16724 Transcript_4667/m.16724 type:complete len:247 (-) Transcript_4667:226-966(-)